MIFAGEAGVG